MRDVLTGKAEVGQDVLISGGQRHIHGLSTADFPAQQGKKVELITPDPSPGQQMESITRATLFQRLYLAGVKLTPNTILRGISDNTITVANVYTDEEKVIEGIDTVVLAYGGVENNDLYYALKGQVKELYHVGDGNVVRKLLYATNDEATIGRMI